MASYESAGGRLFYQQVVASFRGDGAERLLAYLRTAGSCPSWPATDASGSPTTERVRAVAGTSRADDTARFLLEVESDALAFEYQIVVIRKGPVVSALALSGRSGEAPGAATEAAAEAAAGRLP